MLDDDKSRLPTHHASSAHLQRRPRSLTFISFLILATITYLSIFLWQEQSRTEYIRIPRNAHNIAEKCSRLRLLPSPPPDFYNRKESDRFDAFLTPKKPTLVRNATIWTGEVAEGLEIVFGDVLLDKGIIKGVGTVDFSEGEVKEINVNGAWVTAGIVDLHSHLGDFSAPSLSGSADTNSHKGLAQPWLRSVDALNTHDEAYRLAIAGGVTSAVVLPGSAGAIGGQAFPIKLRPTSEKSTSSMLLESPFDSPSHWRHLKQACGENPSRVYLGTRMDTIWSFRATYDEARKLKEKQDAFCEKVETGRWDLLQNESFPEDLQWEALVDVLRGKVKIQNHCYEEVDLDGIVRLSNEFNFSIAGFHHAHEAYLVPELLKKTYGHTPVVAMFATNGRYKRESYRGSEYAPKVLSDNGIDVVMKSDHPVLNSRYLLHEAQQAHYYGLSASLALASITTTPAKASGLDHRIGKVKTGYDADLVIWDSHPLALGATPIQVYVDGIPQLSHTPTSVHPNPQKGQTIPQTPQFKEEAREAVKADGLPSLDAKEVTGTVVFYGVKSLYIRISGRIFDIVKYPEAKEVNNEAKVLVRNGEVICVAGVDLINTANLKTCDSSDLDAVAVDATGIDLEGGSMAPGLSSFGAPLGLQHIAGEVSTGDGKVDSKIVGPDAIRAVDGLQFSTRDALLAYRSGVTVGITPPSLGLATAFSTGAKHKLQQGAIVKEETALHVIITLNAPEESVSTQIRNLRKALVGAVNGGGEGGLGEAFKRVIEGKIPLVVSVQSADVMATLIKLKKEVEDLLASKDENKRKQIRVTFVGAAEAHLIAPEIAYADIGVVVAPTRPFPFTWESLRILPGPPLSEKTAVSTLLEHKVDVAIGVFSKSGAWVSRNARWDAAWIALDSNGTINNAEALELTSTKLEGLLGLDVEESDRMGEMVATRGGELLEFEGKVVAVVSKKTQKMGRALFSQAYTAPAIHEDNAYVAENPLEKPGYDRWSITNPFDPDSDEFFSNAQTERFLEPDELTEQQVLISSSVPPSDTDPDLLPPNAGSPVTNWVAVGPNMWARTVRRATSLSTQHVPSQMDPLESASSSGTTTPRSASPQTPDPAYSPTLPGLVPTELLARLPPPATTTTITAATPSLTGTSPRRRRLTNPQGESLSPPLSVSPRLYTWSRSRSDEDDSQLQSPTVRRIRSRIDSGSTSATSSTRSVRRARTRSLGPVHQHPESLMPGAGSWHERSSYQRFSVVSADSGHFSTNRNETGGSANSRISRLLSGIDDENTVAMVRRLLERSDRTREYARDRVGDLDNHIERLARERERILSAHLQDLVAREQLSRRGGDTTHEEETEPFIPEPEALRFVAL